MTESASLVSNLICHECKTNEYIVISDGLGQCSKCGLETNVTAYEGEREILRAKNRLPSACGVDGVDRRDRVNCNIYDCFNVILAKLTDATVACGAPSTIKEDVLKLWMVYLSKIGIAFCPAPQHHSAKGPPIVIREGDTETEVPCSLLGADDTQQEKKDVNRLAFSVPITKKLNQKKKKKMDLRTLSMEEAIELYGSRGVKRQRRQIIENVIKSKMIRSAHNDSGSESLQTSDTESTYSESVSSVAPSVGGRRDSSRLSTIMEYIPEAFPPGLSLEAVKRERKTQQFLGAKLVRFDPEYLTLHKLFCFIHGALLMRGIANIQQCDLIRWTREAHIPLIRAFRLLPDTMNPGKLQRKVLIALVSTEGIGVPSMPEMNRKTAKLLRFVGVNTLPRPPLHILALKIIQDLQLPRELVSMVRELNSLVCPHEDRNSWKKFAFSKYIDDGNRDAGALILIALKIMFGLDDRSEAKYSAFAAQANELLGRNPSSMFSERKPPLQRQTAVATGKTFFDIQEYLRFLEYRKWVIEQHHVPTAINEGKSDQLDPSLMLQFAANEGLWHFKRQEPILPEKFHYFVESIVGKLEGISSTPCNDERLPFPSFKPTNLGIHGLAEQLYEFDPVKFKQLNQTFPDATVLYALDRTWLTKTLQAAPESVNVRLGSFTIDEIEVTTSLNLGLSAKPHLREAGKGLGTVARFVFVPLDISAFVGTSSDTTLDDSDENVITLELPSSIYWIRTAGKIKELSKDEWAYLSAQLPSNFMKMLNHVASSINEAPRDVYMKMISYETAIFHQHSEISATITPPTSLLKRLRKSLFHIAEVPWNVQ